MRLCVDRTPPPIAFTHGVATVDEAGLAGARKTSAIPPPPGRFLTGGTTKIVNQLRSRYRICVAWLRTAA